jgi:hypothetical protein
LDLNYVIITKLVVTLVRDTVKKNPLSQVKSLRKIRLILLYKETNLELGTIKKITSSPQRGAERDFCPYLFPRRVT